MVKAIPSGVWLALFAACGAFAQGARAPAPAAPDSANQAPQQVEIVATPRGAVEQKTLAQLFAARDAFERHRALAPAATLAFRLYPRLHAEDFAGLELWFVEGGTRRLVPLDEQQRFVLDASWTSADAARGAVLKTNLPEGEVAWKVEVRTPGWPDDERRLGDLRLECETDMFRGNLQRGLHTPSAAIMAAAGDLCELDDAEIFFAERALFGVTMASGARARRLPYRYVHCSDGTMALAPLFDWPYYLRDRSFYLPLGDRSWPDDTRVVFDYMDNPQPAGPASVARSP